MLYSVLLMGAILMGVGTGIAIGVLMENRSVHIAHWATRICIVVGFIMCYYSITVLGV